MEKEPAELLKEAYSIASGDNSITPHPDHIKALVTCLEELRVGTEKLRIIMHTAYVEACKRREAKGLPAFPPPPALQPGGLFDKSIGIPNANGSVSMGKQGTKRGLSGPRALPPKVREST